MEAEVFFNFRWQGLATGRRLLIDHMNTDFSDFFSEPAEMNIILKMCLKYEKELNRNFKYCLQNNNFEKQNFSITKCIRFVFNEKNKIS